MNAAEQARDIAMATKIAAIVNLFKVEFPDLRSDLKPWMNDPETRDLVDPDSIDIGFHFPGLSRSSQCRSLLVQIRFHDDPLEHQRRAIGLELAGYDHRGQQWRLSTVERWEFRGNSEPKPEVQEKFKRCCREVLSLF
ncbi:MAG: hypothetical protein EAZ61_05530 [Oscillatoriales cyanobacterium]|jgi:hypothetical protein|nr:MAG: hypothetical protein EAZ61_05530 [Oscillatoriales cyanobacterium]